MLWRDTRGSVAAEYALIVALVGGGLALASATLGHAVKEAGEIHNFGPDGVKHVCTSNCHYADYDYCYSVNNTGDPATFSPAITGKCDGETPIS
jgi:hypothetical protein